MLSAVGILWTIKLKHYVAQQLVCPSAIRPPPHLSRQDRIAERNKSACDSFEVAVQTVLESFKSLL